MTIIHPDVYVLFGREPSNPGIVVIAWMNRDEPCMCHASQVTVAKETVEKTFGSPRTPTIHGISRQK